MDRLMALRAEQYGKAFLVRRRLVIPEMQSEFIAQALDEWLKGLAGVQQVDFEIKRNRLHVSYDASQVGFDDIEAALVHAGYPPARNRWARIKAAWYRYQDESDRNNATSKGGACCSNPGDIYAKRHK